MKKTIMAGALAGVMLLSCNVYASVDIHENSVQTNIVERIRNADKLEDEKQVKESIADRINRIKEKMANPVTAINNNRPKVAIMYVNNSKSTYDDEVDKEIFKYLNKALSKDVYELVDGSPFVEKLNKLGYMDISTAERADFVDIFQGEDVDYCLYLEIQPFVARDKMTFFTIGKDITTAVPFKMIDLGTGRYLYSGKYTEKASDSTMIGGIGNKSVALKAIDSVGSKVLSEIQVRLPKTRAVKSVAK